MPLQRLLDRFRERADMRLALYDGAKQFALILAIGILIKSFVCDSVKMDGAQMEPAIRAGDRTLLLKAPYATPVISRLFTSEGKLVISALPNSGANTILRIAATSGDTVSVDGGQFYRGRNASAGFGKDVETFGVVPAEYSPADFMAPYRVPAPKDTVTFKELTLRDLIFAYSVARQEKRSVRLRAFVMDGDSLLNGYRIDKFSLYSGSIDSIPDKLAADWFFWDRLQGYLDMQAQQSGAERPLELAFSVYRGHREISGFKVKKRYVFLMGDNWTGAKDSRYIGPVRCSYIRGRPVMMLWGFYEDDLGRKKFNGGRVLKFVR